MTLVFARHGPGPMRWPAVTKKESHHQQKMLSVVHSVVPPALFRWEERECCPFCCSQYYVSWTVDCWLLEVANRSDLLHQPRSWRDLGPGTFLFPIAGERLRFLLDHPLQRLPNQPKGPTTNVRSTCICCKIRFAVVAVRLPLL